MTVKIDRSGRSVRMCYTAPGAFTAAEVAAIKEAARRPGVGMVALEVASDPRGSRVTLTTSTPPEDAEAEANRIRRLLDAALGGARAA